MFFDGAEDSHFCIPVNAMVTGVGIVVIVAVLGGGSGRSCVHPLSSFLGSNLL